MQLRLETDGAAIVRGFLSDQDSNRIAEIAGNAFAFLDGGGGDSSLRETWISVGAATSKSSTPARCSIESMGKIGSDFHAIAVTSMRGANSGHSGVSRRVDVTWNALLR
jgi:hypothetical protein